MRYSGEDYSALVDLVKTVKLKYGERATAIKVDIANRHKKAHDEWQQQYDAYISLPFMVRMFKKYPTLIQTNHSFSELDYELYWHWDEIESLAAQLEKYKFYPRLFRYDVSYVVDVLVKLAEHKEAQCEYTAS